MVTATPADGEWLLEWDSGNTVSRRALPYGRDFLIGKDPECDWVAVEPGISRKHLRLKAETAGIEVYDLESTNGTSLDGNPLSPGTKAVAREGSVIVLGRIAKVGVQKAQSFRPLDCEFSELLTLMAGIDDETHPSKELKLAAAFATPWGGALTEADKARLSREVLAAGPLTDLLVDPEVSEVAVNGPSSIWVERAGEMRKVEGAFVSEQSLLHFVRRLLAPVGRTLDPRFPIVDARLLDGSRLCAVTSPAVLGGTHLSIRRFLPGWNRWDRFRESGSLSPAAEAHLARAIAERKNILVSGGTGVGKTSLLGAIAGQVPREQRILTLEDTAELLIDHPHVVRLESRPPNLEGEGEVSLRALLRAGLRLRPDRIILGECRGPEAIDLLQALNTGHAGSMATIHANSARDALSRLEVLCMLGSESALSPEVARQYIAAAVQVIVHLGRRHGKRRIETIDEVAGVDGGIILLRSVAL